MKRRFFVGMAFVFSVFLLCSVGSRSEAANTLLDNVDASNIGIKAQYKIAGKDSFTGYIKYSPDGRFLLYSQRDQIVIIDVATRKIQKVFKADYTAGFAWSPDGARIVYCNGGNVIIHDIKSGKSINVTYANSAYTPKLTWFKEDKIDFSMKGVLDLNSLSFTEISEEEALLVKKNIDRCLDAVCFAGGDILAPRTGYYSRDYFDDFDSADNVKKSKTSGNENNAIPSVAVSNKDGSFTKVLAEIDRYGASDISPKCDSFAFQKDGLYLAYLDTNFKTEKIYSVEDFQPLLNDDLKSKYNSFMSRDVPIIGEVYAPKINPLTGKVIGPGSEYKGSVKITGSSNGTVVVQKIFERTAFKTGVDVVSNLIAVLDEGRHKKFIEFKNIWRTLQTISDKEPLTIRVPPTTPPPTAAILPEDCLPYNPANLQVVNERAIGWLLTDGGSRMLKLANEADARDALALAKRYTAQCFIGRGNTRSNRKDYIIEYWRGKSGLTTTITQRDCISYNPANLQIVDEGASGWLLTDGGSRMLKLANEADARDALALAKLYTAHCFIGRGNTRSNRKDYIIEYWE